MNKNKKRKNNKKDERSDYRLNVTRVADSAHEDYSRARKPRLSRRG